MQPGAGKMEIPGDGVRMQIKHDSNLLLVHPGEEVHLEDSRFPVIERGEYGEGFIERKEINRGRRGGGGITAQRERLGAGAAPQPQPPAGMIYQDLAHVTRGDGEEVSPIRVIMVRFADQLEIGFVDKSGGLEGVAVALAAHQARGNGPEFAIEEGSEAIEGRGVPITPFPQQERDGVSRFGHTGKDS